MGWHNARMENPHNNKKINSGVLVLFSMNQKWLKVGLNIGYFW
jgi:hypothetical protein